MVGTVTDRTYSSGHMKQFLGRVLAGCLAIVVVGSLGIQVFAESNSVDTSAIAWSSPSVKAIKRVSSIITAQHEPVFFQNLNCSLLTYRYPTSDIMQTGCYGETSYGLFDPATSNVIFNSTDEALPLLPAVSQQILLPWNKSSELMSLNLINTGGAYLSLYRNTLTATQDVRNIFGQLTAKQLVGSPDILLKDREGQPLVINPGSLAFSDNGSWLVAETLHNSFVRINLASLEVVPFAPAFFATGSPGFLQSQVAVSNSGRFIALHNEAAGSFKIYDLKDCTAGLCKSYDYQPFISQNITGVQAIRHVRFVNNELLSFEAQSHDVASSGVYEIAPADSIHSLIDYLGLGDSFSAGEGAFDYAAGSDTSTNHCHLSARSYPMLLTHDLFSAVGGHSVACSGAVIRDVGSTSDSYRGQVSGVASYPNLAANNPLLLESLLTNYLPGYVAQQRFVERYQPRIMTVSIGGNDIGFGDILLNCVMPHLTRHTSSESCYNTYEDRLELIKLIDRTLPHWTALYKQLVATSPGSQLYAVGYPSLAADKGRCALNTLLSKEELVFSEELISYLNGAIAQAADAAGVTYVDISQALVGHRLCETASYNVAVNGLTAGKDAGLFGVNVLGTESYHPNALGQSLIEQAILLKTHNLTTASAATSTKTTTGLLDVPKTNRVVRTKLPQKIAPQVVKRGTTIRVHVDGAAAGLRPRTSYRVSIGGAAGTILAIVTSDSNADIDAEITLPPGVTSGGQTIDIIGDNQNGEPVDVTQPIFVPVSDNDADGDGIPDNIDSCPNALNSGVDEDHDGVDDVCDGFIGSAASTGASSTATGAISPSGESTQINQPPVVATVLQAGITPQASFGTASGSTSYSIATGVTSAKKFSAPVLAVTKPIMLNGVLGSKRLNKQRLEGARPGHTAKKSTNYQKLLSINWMRWGGLFLILWLLLFGLIWFLSCLDKRQRRIQHSYRSYSPKSIR